VLCCNPLECGPENPMELSRSTKTPMRQVASGGLTQNSLEAVGQSRSQQPAAPGSWTVGGGNNGMALPPLVGGAPTLQAAVHGAAAAAAAAAQQVKLVTYMALSQSIPEDSRELTADGWRCTTAADVPCVMARLEPANVFLRLLP